LGGRRVSGISQGDLSRAQGRNATTAVTIVNIWNSTVLDLRRSPIQLRVGCLSIFVNTSNSELKTQPLGTSTFNFELEDPAARASGVQLGVEIRAFGDGMQIEITANGLKFAALVEGPADGPLALCLHGFPDSAHTWRYLLPELAAAGFRAVAPWMRGYAPTAVPADGSSGGCIHRELDDERRSRPWLAAQL